MTKLCRWCATAGLMTSLAVLAGCGGGGAANSAAKADAENPALINSMPQGGQLNSKVPGMGGGPSGQGGPGMGKAGMDPSKAGGGQGAGQPLPLP
jgi:hypothetical protein